MFEHWKIDYDPLRYTVAIPHLTKYRSEKNLFVNFFKKFYRWFFYGISKK